MAHQSPLIALPRKRTTDTDFTTPLRHAIAHTYGERPDAYAQEIATLARCRADAVSGAGSDTTARDLLFKYFGQLELLELRFAQQKIAFDWHDAFTDKATQQTSLAFEKASVLHLLASHLSSFAASQPRVGNPDGIKRAYTALRQCAGLLGFINENFLHAPSTDLSREVLTFCAQLMTVQAAQVFLERCMGEKKPPSLTGRMAQSVAQGYTALAEDAAQFQGKGILDRAWLDVVTIKSKYYASLAAWYRASHDQDRGEYGASASRFAQAEMWAAEAHKLAKEFTYSFIPSTNSAAAAAAALPATFYPAQTTTAPPTLPIDSATSLLELTKTHLATTQESKTTAERDNDLIYHALPIPLASLPPVDPLPLTTLATLVTIQEIYAQPDISALIGPDIFRRLVPLEVHEQASVYSEEKAKLVRGEVERCDSAEGEVRVALEALDPRGRVTAFRALAGGPETAVPEEVVRFGEQIAQREQAQGVGQMLDQLDAARRGCVRSIEELTKDLDDESRECERMRVKYSHKWSQQPSGTFTRAFRGDLKAHADSLHAAGTNDASIAGLWRSIASDVGTLASPDRRRALDRVFHADAPQVDLLDYDVPSTGLGPDEERQVGELVDEVEASLKRLEAVKGEQAEVLKDLKQKVQADDVSHLLLLNRGRTQEGGTEPTLFATELEKFKPYQARLAAAVQTQKDVLEDIAHALKRVEAVPGVKRMMRERAAQEARARSAEERYRNAWDGYQDVRAGIEKGLHFYESMNTLLDSLRRDIRAFIASRTQERNRLIADAETRDRLAGSTSPRQASRGLEDQLAGLRVSPSPGPGPPSPYAGYSHPSTSPPPISGYASSPSHLPPPPPRPTGKPPAPPTNPYDFSSFGSAGLPSAFSPGYANGAGNPYAGMSAPPPPPPPQQQGPYTASRAPYPPPPPRPSAYSSAPGVYPPPPGQQPPPSGQGYYPPPPPPAPYGYPSSGAGPGWNQSPGQGGQGYR